ncbi:hypothetical protein Droror1_Dr00019468 [Drosera rotundifolia]
MHHRLLKSNSIHRQIYSQFTTLSSSTVPFLHPTTSNPFPLNSKLPQICSIYPQIPLPSCSNQRMFQVSGSFEHDRAEPSCVLSSKGQFRDWIAERLRDSRCPDEARRLGLEIVKRGFVGDLFLQNSLINGYVRSADLGCARKVFDEMSVRNEVTWACLVSGYAQNGMPLEACDLFKRMVAEGLEPTSFALGSALRACQELGPDGFGFGRQIHGLITKTEFRFDVVLSNVLMSVYSDCMESVEYARRVFDEIQDRNLVSWNSIISICSQRGEVSTCFELLLAMENRCSEFGFKPNEYTLCSLVAAASFSFDLGPSLLEQVLSKVLKCGYLGDLYVGSALVSGLAKLGSTESAKKIFEQMSSRNAVSLNGLMVGLVKQKKGGEAVEVFKEMKHLVRANIDSYMVLLSALAEFSGLGDGRIMGSELHAYLIRTGLGENNIAIENGLVNMYAKCGAINYASTVFRLMGERNSVSWNCLIAGLDQNECYEETIANFCIMRSSGLEPSNFTLISSLSSCASLGWIKMGTQIHGEALKLGLDFDVSVSNAVLALYAETENLFECHKMFYLMPEHDGISWNSIIGTLANSKSSVLRAVEYFLEMMRCGYALNRITFINILSAASSLSVYELGQQIHALAIKHSVADVTVIENALISCYGKCGRMEESEVLFSRMTDRRDEFSWNAMISGYIHNEQLSKAMDLVWCIMQDGRRLDRFTFATVLSACASVATLERGMEVHGCQVRTCLESDVVVGSAIIDMYAKSGRIDYASRYFDLMPVKNVYSWNSMISGYARHGQANEALEVFQKMKLVGQSPDHVTFVSVLSACSHSGLVKEGTEHFESMTRQYGLVPRMEHFSCMVDLLGRAGRVGRLEDFINKMPVKPSALTWRTVLGSCARANKQKTELARRAVEKLLELEPESAVNYVLLSNMYASGGNWESMAKARSAMSVAAVKKETGRSWVTMKDGLHVFVSGDKSHPEKDATYEKLAELQQKMKDAGYVPLTSFSLYDVDPESKEEFLSYHSERLAVAFALTRSSISTIRIMKNLRVCGDCHSAFCYISKIENRQIVLRDSNRFHHFADGKCSCGDYW